MEEQFFWAEGYFILDTLLNRSAERALETNSIFYTPFGEPKQEMQMCQNSQTSCTATVCFLPNTIEIESIPVTVAEPRRFTSPGGNTHMATVARKCSALSTPPAAVPQRRRSHRAAAISAAQPGRAARGRYTCHTLGHLEKHSTNQPSA